MTVAKELTDAKVLFGHPKNYSNPKTRGSWAGVSGNMVVFDPQIVADQIARSRQIFLDAKEKKQEILVLCEKEIYKTEIEVLATTYGFFYMNHKIPAGVVTNFDTLLSSIKNLQEMRSYLTSESFSTLTKKEQNMRKRKLEKVEKVYKGVVGLRKKPDLVIVVDGQMMHKFVKELMSTKTRGIVLTSSNFDLYADVQTVMCNVNSQRSLDFVMNAIVGKGE